MQHCTILDLPSEGYLRQRQIIGVAPVTPEQARNNKATGKGPRRPRPGSTGIVPFSAPTLWRKVKAGEFPAPVKLSAGVTAWSVASVRQWLDSKASADSPMGGV